MVMVTVMVQATSFCKCNQQTSSGFELSESAVSRPVQALSIPNWKVQSADQYGSVFSEDRRLVQTLQLLNIVSRVVSFILPESTISRLVQ